MNAKAQRIDLKYLPKLWAALGFLLLLAAAILLAIGRKSEWVRPRVVLNTFPDFYQHVSNLSISCMLVSGAGYFWLLMGLPLRYIGWLAAVTVVVNFVYELWISVLNTPDLVDAYYGAIGALAAFCFLGLMSRFGLMENNLAGKNQH